MNKNRVKMIAFDLDGTLLTTGKQITEYTKEVLRKAVWKGFEVVPATGRPLRAVPEELFRFPGIRYMVTSNGARVIERESRKTIFSMLLSLESAKEILDIFKEYDTMRDIFYDGQGYTEEKKVPYIERYVADPVLAEYLRTSRIPVKDIDKMLLDENRDADKVQALFSSTKERDEALVRLKELPGAEPSASLRSNIEVNAEGVHKGIALTKLGEKLGIMPEEILAFGDGTNDIKMLRTVGTGIAMENAAQEVKDAADGVTLPNDEEGVAKYIEKYIL